MKKKNNSKWVIDLNIRRVTLTLPEENMEQQFEDKGIGDSSGNRSYHQQM
jgi:hypothetical protein